MARNPPVDRSPRPPIPDLAGDISSIQPKPEAFYYQSYPIQRCMVTLYVVSEQIGTVGCTAEVATLSEHFLVRWSLKCGDSGGIDSPDRDVHEFLPTRIED